MAKKYEKEVIHHYLTVWNGQVYQCYVLQGNLKSERTHDIHILDDDFKEDEMNTLKLQTLNDLSVYDDVWCDCQIMEHILWKKHYCDPPLSFSIDIYRGE